MKLGGLCPIQLVLQVYYLDNLLEATVTNKLNEKAKDTYVKFLGGSAEHVVCHVKLFYSLVDKMELVSQYESKTMTLKDNCELLLELGPIMDSSPLDEIQQQQDLEEEKKDHSQGHDDFETGVLDALRATPRIIFNPGLAKHCAI